MSRYLKYPDLRERARKLIGASCCGRNQLALRELERTAEARDNRQAFTVATPNTPIKDSVRGRP